MNNLKRMILVCAAVCLVFPAYAAGADNFGYVIVYPNYTHGQYLCLEAGLEIAGDLEAFEDVKSVKVKHEETGWKADLVAHGGIYNLRILPQKGMYEGTWRFTLKYKDKDGNKHSQIKFVQMGEVAFPPPPFRIRIWLEGDSYNISWSGIGDPEDLRCKYRVRVYTEDWSDSWTIPGGYDPDLNLVIVDVPFGRDWEGYSIRMENLFFSPRGDEESDKYEPYGQRNKAMTHGRLLPKSIDYD